MERKNIIIGKIGKSIKFKNLHIETGDDACMIFYSQLARMNPTFNFYIVGPNELNKLSEKEYDYIFPNHNVMSAHGRDKTKKEDQFEPILKYFEDRNIKIDFALIMNGLSSRSNIPEFLVNKKTGNKLITLQVFGNYAAPYLYTLNKLGCPFYLISEDARYITVNAKDLYNRERLIFSQINKTFETATHITSEDDLLQEHMVTSKAKAIYSGCERIFMMGIDKNWKENIDIDRKLNSTGNHLIVISNGCGQTKENRPGNNSMRYDTYKKWIIDGLKGTKYEDTKIYGIWDKEIYDICPNIQNKKMLELGDEIADARYTLVYSIMPGFVTVKPWEMILKGLIPFIHPDYDKYHLLPLPEYCYVKSVDDFINKMNELDENPEKYKQVLNECFACIKDEDLNGTRLNNVIFSEIGKDLGFEYEEVHEEFESKFNHFAKNIFDAEKVK